MPVSRTDLTVSSTDWFDEFIAEAYKKQQHPCQRKVIDRALAYLKARKAAEKPEEFVLIHGDAHSGNLLQTLSGQAFKFVDLDGMFYEKPYDLGVLKREWVQDHLPDPFPKGRQRCENLHRLTGVSRQAIWEWGYVQTVSTALVLLQIGQDKTGRQMLQVAERWAEAIEHHPSRTLLEEQNRKQGVRILRGLPVFESPYFSFSSTTLCTFRSNTN